MLPGVRHPYSNDTPSEAVNEDCNDTYPVALSPRSLVERKRLTSRSHRQVDLLEAAQLELRTSRPSL